MKPPKIVQIVPAEYWVAEWHKGDLFLGKAKVAAFALDASGTVHALVPGGRTGLKFADNDEGLCLRYMGPEK